MADVTENKGFDPKEIQQLKDECRQEGTSFAYIEDEDIDMMENGECVHIQFVGPYQDREVIYDAIMYTLRLHHSSLVYEQAMEKVKATYPQYVPLEDRKPGYRIDPKLEEEIEIFLTELIEEIEENESIKVQEHVEVDPDTDYGVGLDVCLNVEEITDEVVEAFVRDFNAGSLSLDTTLYSFTSSEEDE